jgi:tRNA(Ile)-lysidine synthase
MAASRKSPSADEPEQRMLRAVEPRLIAEVDKGALVTVGFSGGVDSVVLLDVLRRLAEGHAFRLRALHVHHGLSPNADHWAQFCQAHCARRAIEFQCVRIDVKGRGRNVEANARNARYEAFAQHGSEVVALAHNLNDQVETVLLNLLRGATVHGMRGMPPVRPATGRPAVAKQTIIRPFRDVPRSVVAQYAKRRRLRFIEDESNADDRFARNFIRLHVTPLLERRFPGSQATIARAASQFAEAATLLDALADIDLKAVSVRDQLSVARLSRLGAARAANAFRRYLARRGDTLPSSARVREVLRQLSARDDASPVVRLGRVLVRRYRGMIALVPDTDACRIETPIAWRGETRIELPGGSALIVARRRGEGLRAADIRGGDMTIRSREGGERMRVMKDGPTRTLKNLLQERGVPPWQRGSLPLVFHGDKLVWVPFLGYAAEQQASATEDGLTFHWLAPDAGSASA